VGFEAIALAVLGSGGFAAILTFVIARRKAPAEVDSIIVTGAESAVLSLQKAVEAATLRATTAETQLAASHERERRKDERIELLEQRLDRVQNILDDVRAELAAVRRGDDE